MRSSWRSITITLGCSRDAIAMASAPSEQVITVLPAALSRYAIRSLLALLSSTTRIRLSLFPNAIPRHDEAENAALSQFGGELDAAAQESCQTLADVKTEAGALSRRGAVFLELLECLEQLCLVFDFDPRAGVYHVESDYRVTVSR